MSQSVSTKPYMVRAIHEWCIDNGFTPYLAVEVNAETRVPMGYVKDGEIILNVNYTATRDLEISNDAVTFSARFNGVSTNLYVPMDAVRGIFARESGQGLFFETAVKSVDVAEAASGDASSSETPPPKRPTLHVVK